MGSGADVVSIGELLKAKKAGIKSNKIVFSGVGKTEEEILMAVRKKVLLINVGRGSTLCEKELIAHLKKNKNFFVSLDVFETEPLTKISPLWKIPNVTITPHIASITLSNSAVEYIYKKYRQYKKNGKIKSDVNFKKGY